MTKPKKGQRKPWARRKARAVKVWAVVDPDCDIILSTITRNRLELMFMMLDPEARIESGSRIARVKIEETI